MKMFCNGVQGKVSIDKDTILEAKDGVVEVDAKVAKLLAEAGWTEVKKSKAEPVAVKIEEPAKEETKAEEKPSEKSVEVVTPAEQTENQRKRPSFTRSK